MRHMDTPAERLVWARARAGFDSAAAFARKNGAPEVTYRSHENGKRGINEAAARSYAKNLGGINWGWIITGEGEPYGGGFLEGPEDLLARRRRHEQRAAAAAKETENMATPELPPVMPTRDSMPKDVKVFGTAAGSLGKGSIQMDMGDPIDLVRRPPGIANATDVYAIYVVGDSMFPKFDEGELVYVSERRPARQGDYVVVQVKNDVHEDVQGYIKRLVSRSTDKLVLEQLHPEAIVEFANGKIISVHRILNMNELMGI